MVARFETARRLANWSDEQLICELTRCWASMSKADRKLSAAIVREQAARRVR